MSVAFLFPGQGAQYPGMLHGLADDRSASSIVTRANDFLGYDVLTLDTPDSLNSSVAVQLATFIGSVAAAQALEAHGASADAVAGLSVGAFGAAVACGAIDFEAALEIVQLRARVMEEECPSGYGMAVILGLDERRVNALLEACNTQGAATYVANLNAPEEIVISGSDKDLDLVLSSALLAGARRAERLLISVPSHCPLLSGVAAKLVSAMAAIKMSRPRLPYISNRTGRPLMEVEAVRKDLATNVEHPVRWHEVTAILFEAGVRLFVELPPGYTLTGLASKAFPEARAIALENNSLELVAKLIIHNKVLTRAGYCYRK